MHLEIISRFSQPPAPDRPAPLLFVHGAFGNAGLWDEHFLPYFAAQGYAAHALSLRGHGGSKPQSPRLLTGVADYVRDLDQAVQNLGVTPVLIGHSPGRRDRSEMAQAPSGARCRPHGLGPPARNAALGPWHVAAQPRPGYAGRIVTSPRTPNRLGGDHPQDAVLRESTAADCILHWLEQTIS